MLFVGNGIPLRSFLRERGDEHQPPAETAKAPPKRPLNRPAPPRSTSPTAQRKQRAAAQLRTSAMLLALLCLTSATAPVAAMPSPYNADRTNFSGSQSQLPDDQMSGFSSLTRDKWIGLTLAISSSLAIGTSFIITKKGLMDAADRGSGLASDGHTYLQNPIWWAGMATMIVGEVANFAAYTFAPPILVTPLGALSVLIGAVLASFILKEELGRLGRVGCGLCLVGTVIIVVNAPEDKEIQTVDEMLNYALQPGFMFYCLFVLAFALFMIFRMVPKYGRKTPLVYISICSLVGSISVMSVKGLGVALKLTFDGNNQFSHPSTYCFLIVVVVCILTQMNYFNKALDQFNTNVVNPIYYVTFTTSTLLASFLLFRGFNTSGAAPAVSLLGGFLVIFAGVYLLNLNRLIDPVTQQPRMSLMTGEGTTRYSEHQERLLAEHGRSRHSLGGGGGGGSNRASFSGGHGVSAPRRSSVYGNHHHGRRDSAGSSVLFNAYENEEALGLTRLDEDSDEATSASSPMLRQGTPNGKPHASFNGAPPRRVRTPNNGAPHVNGARDPSVTSKQQKRRSLIDDVQED